jgi:hypothetical protein
VSGLIDSFLVKTGLDLTLFGNPAESRPSDISLSVIINRAKVPKVPVAGVVRAYFLSVRRPIMKKNLG